jgi:hypothetical protein
MIQCEPDPFVFNARAAPATRQSVACEHAKLHGGVAAHDGEPPFFPDPVHTL